MSSPTMSETNTIADRDLDQHGDATVQGLANATPQNRDQEKGLPSIPAWDDDPVNPYNWPKWKKMHLVVTISATAFVA